MEINQINNPLEKVSLNCCQWNNGEIRMTTEDEIDILKHTDLNAAASVFSLQYSGVSKLAEHWVLCKAWSLERFKNVVPPSFRS